MDKTFIHAMPIHPGVTLLETLESLRMTQVDIAERTGLTVKTINEIIQGKNPITADTAVKLASVFGVSAMFWNNLQRVYDAASAREREIAQLQAETKMLAEVGCYSELVEWEYIPAAVPSVEKVRNLLNFFGVSSLKIIADVEAVAFRRPISAKVNPYCLAAWLRCGEIEARKLTLKPFDSNRLAASLKDFRSLTIKEPKVFVPEIQNKCAECGVAVVFVPHFKNTYVNGATRWLDHQTALAQLSLRYKWEDIFWFTFFHEFGHILRHGKKEQFIDMAKSTDGEKERDADNFAQEALISKESYARFEKENDFSFASIERFAQQEGISPAVVAGRLSHNTGDWKKWAKLRRKFEFVRS